MDIRKFNKLTNENSHPPRKNDKWFRLLKLVEEYGEWKDAVNPKDQYSELENVLHTSSLLLPFVDRVDNKEEYSKLSLSDFRGWGIKAVTKEIQEDLDSIYYYVMAEVMRQPFLNDICQSAYERLVCNSLFKQDNAQLVVDAIERCNHG